MNTLQPGRPGKQEPLLAQPVDYIIAVRQILSVDRKHPFANVAAGIGLEVVDELPLHFSVIAAHGDSQFPMVQLSDPAACLGFVGAVFVAELCFQVTLFGQNGKPRDKSDKHRHQKDKPHVLGDLGNA